MKALFKPSELLRPARKLLREAGLPDNGAEWLLMDLFDLSKLQLMMDDGLLTEAMKEAYEAALNRLAEGTPLGHITGFQMFYGRKFIVSGDVLIPRPETEELVAKALTLLSNGTVADIGTGSGCIAITLTLESQMEVYAVDISEAALQIARENNAILEGSVNFLQGDLLTPIEQSGIKLDMLISNPPYIADAEKKQMSASVLDYDPHLALFAEDKGLALYKRMIQALPAVMKNNGYVLFEIGHAQGTALKDYIYEMWPQLDIHIEKDINQLDRIIWFKWCQ